MTYEKKNYNTKNAHRNTSVKYLTGSNRTSDAARYAQRHGMNGANDNAPGAQKHCPTCQCSAHSMGGLENSLFGVQLPNGAQPVAYQITIYALPAELLKGYDLGAPKNRYNAANDNDSYEAKGSYDKKRAA